jgi:FAD/FMN-containing dehydrogenase
MRRDFGLSRILLIRPNLSCSLYRDAILGKYGFPIEIATPSEVPEILHTGSTPYSVVVISDSLAPKEVREVAEHVRQSSPRTRIVVIQGLDSSRVDQSLYDALVDIWNGPSALIDTVQRLTVN